MFKKTQISSNKIFKIGTKFGGFAILHILCIREKKKPISLFCRYVYHFKLLSGWIVKTMHKLINGMCYLCIK